MSVLKRLWVDFILIAKSEPYEGLTWTSEPDLKYYLDPEKKQETDGRIEVRPGPGRHLIEWCRIKGDEPPTWRFHELTVHPRDPASGKLDLIWMVTPDRILMHDKGPGGGRTESRHFNYTLSIKVEGLEGGSTKYYFDPELVDIGGGR